MSTKRIISQTIGVLLLVLVVSFCAVTVQAGTHYVSPAGSATWANSTNINTPCSVSTAFANAVSGDVVLFRGGTYNLSQSTNSSNPGFHGILEPSNSGSGDADGSRIIYKAYTGETPVLNGIAGGASDPTWEATLIMTQQKSYITFDGLTFQANNGQLIGRLFIGGEDTGGTGIKVLNCTFNGGSTAKSTSGDNAEGIRLQHDTNTLISGCAMYNFQNSDGENHNTSAIKTYYSTNAIIEKSEIYNSTAGIYWKVATDNPTVRYNYIHNCFIGVYQAHNQSTTDSVYHNNVISKCTYIGLQNIIDNGSSSTRWSAYNNTIYSASNSGTYSMFDGTDGTSSKASDHRFYNNIILGGQYKAVFPYPKAGLTECDYNQYGNSGSFSISANYGGGSSNYSSLAAWQASDWVNGGHPDTHSLASDPKFVNTSGTYSNLADFVLQVSSPCKGSGKGGVDMGANISLVGRSSVESGAMTPPPNFRKLN